MPGVIYKITNKINNKVYIGQTTRSIKKRFSRHCNEKSCAAIHMAIKKYGKENFEITILQNCDNKKDLNKKEKYFIKYFNSKIPNGYNICSGGSAFIKKAIKRKLTQEEKNNIANKLKKLYKNSEIIKKSIKSQPNRFEIICLQNGKKYLSVRQAALDLNLTKSKILDNIHGKSFHVKGYSFSFYDENKKYPVLPKLDSISKKKIKDQYGNVYSSIAAAAVEFNTNRESIRRVLVGKRKTCKGRIFSFMEYPHVI